MQRCPFREILTFAPTKRYASATDDLIYFNLARNSKLQTQTRLLHILDVVFYELTFWKRYENMIFHNGTNIPITS